ncbi:hypothetical protein FBU59_000760 [Linderina macrospora]|uniref:Uncharacterized protein n=1 Tax=Linderina macrospora TaxID=4868 RepID=A0ACC1JG01_9FUNG|nr:hypothetical protein FBU59_000760 [Linderina macrospora]
MASVYVTVGSTGFDELVRAVSTKQFLLALSQRGFTKLTVQYGSSKHAFSPPTSAREQFGIILDSFDYTDSPLRYIEQAGLVICHAGTGSILETLHSQRPAIVVVNRRLMDNHQSEIAEELASKGHVVCAEPEDLAQCVEEERYAGLKAYPHADPRPIGEILDEEML